MLGLLFALAVLHAALYAVLTPPWQAPDEIAHFEYAWLLSRLRHPLANENTSPVLEQAIIQSLYNYHAWTYVGVPVPAEPPDRLADVPFFGRSRTLARFSLGYVVYAVVAWSFADSSLIAQLYAMRATSAIIAALVVLLTYQLARMVEPEAPELAWGSALFVVLLPQHAYLGGAVSDGILAELLSTLTIYGVLKVWRDGITFARLGLILISGLAALLSKATALFLLPFVVINGLAIAKIWYFAPNRSRQQQRQILLGGLAGLGLLGIIGPMVAPWLNRVSSQSLNNFALLLASLDSPSQMWEYLMNITASGAFLRAWAQTFESFWGYFGWMVVRMPAGWLPLPYGVVGLALLGWARHGAAGRVSQPRVRLYPPVMLAAGLALVVLFLWFVMAPTGLEFSQGRYVFGAIAPLAILLVAGCLRLGPRRHQGIVLLGLLAFGVVFDAVMLLRVLVPYFYQVV